MRYKSHIGFIDTHPKSNGGNDNNALFFQKTTLVIGSNRRGQARMVGHRLKPLVGEPFGCVFGFLSRQAVNNARVITMLRLKEA